MAIRFSQNFYVEALREPANDKALKAAAREVLGEGATFDVKGPDATDVASSSLAEIRGKEKAEFEAQRLERLKAHPAVKLATEIFGARIREVRDA